MDTYTSVTYSIQTHNNDTTKKIEYSSTITDDDNKQVSTYYKNIIKNDHQNESFTKVLRDSSKIYQQLGNSINKADWYIQEYENNNMQKEYNDPYDSHNFDKFVLDYLPTGDKLEDKYMIANH